MELSKEQNRRYILFITEAGEDGENDIRIEVATTLERERGANKGKQTPIGIYSTVKVYKVNMDDNPLHSDTVLVSIQSFF